MCLCKLYNRIGFCLASESLWKKPSAQWINVNAKKKKRMAPNQAHCMIISNLHHDTELGSMPWCSEHAIWLNLSPTIRAYFASSKQACQTDINRSYYMEASAQQAYLLSGGVCAAAMATGCHLSVAASDISTCEFIVRLTHGCVRPRFLIYSLLQASIYLPQGLQDAFFSSSPPTLAMCQNLFE